MPAANSAWASRVNFASKAALGAIVFFFQAEDGIRDLIVTGVQTCALPILKPKSCATLERAARSRSWRARSSNHAGAPGDWRSRLFVWQATSAISPTSSSRGDRKRGVEGKRGDLGGRRII